MIRIEMRQRTPVRGMEIQKFVYNRKAFVCLENVKKDKKNPIKLVFLLKQTAIDWCCFYFIASTTSETSSHWYFCLFRLFAFLCSVLMLLWINFVWIVCPMEWREWNQKFLLLFPHAIARQIWDCECQVIKLAKILVKT